MAKIRDHASLIAALDGAASVAAEIDVLPVNVRAWAARNRIPPEYWPALISLAERKGSPITAEWLMLTTPARRRQEAEQVAA